MAIGIGRPRPMLERLRTLMAELRQPDQPAEVEVRNEERLDAVDERLQRIAGRRRSGARRSNAARILAIDAQADIRRARQ